jgi:UDP-glucose:(heptosyl)LPS alpha-1,3-glucosyltransferase
MDYRIAVIIERADIALGGAERSVFELTAALGLLGIEVHVLAAKGRAAAANIHILCQDIPGSRVSYGMFAQALRRHLAENKYDLIHSVLPFPFVDIYQPRGGTYAEAIKRNAASYSSTLIAACKQLTSCLNLRRTALLRAEKKLCKGSQGPVLVALSNYVADQFRNHYGADDTRIKVIPNGVKTTKKTDKARIDRLRTQILTHLRLKEADEPILFLFAANNFRLKGLRPLITALGCVAAANINSPAYLVVAGRGRSAKYRKLARRLDVHDRILFLGKVRHIQNALAVADVGILPTYYDPCSRFILEALAAAKPVITTKFNGATDQFENARHGIIIDHPQDTESLADAIMYFSNRDDLRNTSETILNDNLPDAVSITRAAKQLCQLYESIIAQRRQK